MTRQEANRKILARLGALNESQEDLRFGQLLITAGVTKDSGRPGGSPLNEVSFYEESDSILSRVQRSLERFFYGRG